MNALSGILLLIFVAPEKARMLIAYITMVTRSMLKNAAGFFAKSGCRKFFQPLQRFPVITAAG
jgi:hypothetical protein